MVQQQIHLLLYICCNEGGIAKNCCNCLENNSVKNTTLVVTREGTPITSADELVYGDVLTISATYATGSEKMH